MAKGVRKKPSARTKPGLVIKNGKCAVKDIASASGSKVKIRVGLMCGKWHDPIPRGTQDRDYPENHKCHNNWTSNPNAIGWGGQFHVDVSVGVRMLRMFPDIFEVDLMKGEDISPARMASNHINFNLWYDVMNALQGGDQAHIRTVLKSQKCANVWPAWNYIDWIYHKSMYLKALNKAGIPTIPTIFIDDGFHPDKVLQKVQAVGWKSFFVKPGHWGMFGNGAIHGKTQDFIDDPSKLQQFAREEAKGQKEFLVQPYMLKPDGQVFDEVRNYFIDGEWAYSVFTHGTDDDDVYEEPQGPRKQKAKQIALKAYAEILKVSKWCGVKTAPPLARIDVGVIPTTSGGHKVFINELEPEMTTWLCRYCPFNLVERMASTYVKKTRELLEGLLKAKKPVQNKAEVKKLLKELETRCGALS